MQSGKCLQVFNMDSTVPNFRVDFRVMHEDNTFLYSPEVFKIFSWNLKVRIHAIELDDIHAINDHCSQVR
jgi:hypothetical protein